MDEPIALYSGIIFDGLTLKVVSEVKYIIETWFHKFPE